MVNVDKLEIELFKLDRSRDIAFKRERKVKEMLLDLERQTYEGLTYQEYVDNQDQQISVGEKIKIIIKGYNISGRYTINEEVYLEVNTTIYRHDDIVRGSVKYPSKTVTDIPDKYKKEYEELLQECLKHKIENVSRKYREKYKVNTY